LAATRATDLDEQVDIQPPKSVLQWIVRGKLSDVQSKIPRLRGIDYGAERQMAAGVFEALCSGRTPGASGEDEAM